MGSNISYLKGVRTRYINIVKKEISVGSDILALAEAIGDFRHSAHSTIDR